MPHALRCANTYIYTAPPAPTDAQQAAAQQQQQQLPQAAAQQQQAESAAVQQQQVLPPQAPPAQPVSAPVSSAAVPSVASAVTTSQGAAGGGGGVSSEAFAPKPAMVGPHMEGLSSAHGRWRSLLLGVLLANALCFVALCLHYCRRARKRVLARRLTSEQMLSETSSLL